jgi:hypothetical protein
MSNHALANVTSWPNVRSRTRLRPALRPTLQHRRRFTRTKASVVVLLAVIAGLFSVGAFVGAPATSAPTPSAVDVEAIGKTISGTLPLFEDRHQRHYGVLDPLDK